MVAYWLVVGCWLLVVGSLVLFSVVPRAGGGDKIENPNLYRIVFSNLFGTITYFPPSTCIKKAQR